MSESFVLQPIRDFVVQIRHKDTNEIVGTGFVAKEGIVTCAHVARDAGADPLFPAGLVVVYFPEREGRPSVYRRARVREFFPEHDDDVVLLELVDSQNPLPSELVARLGSARNSQGHSFRSFGYRRLNNFQGLPAHGKIIDFCDKPKDMRLHCEPLMLSSQHIDRGMSGAPVLDLQQDRIIGVIYLSWDSAKVPFDRDTGFAVDARVLSMEPLGLALQEQDLPKAITRAPRVSLPTSRILAPKQTVVWNNAPPLLDEWIGRDRLLGEITEDWVNLAVRIMGLIGFGGEGKSSLTRRWADSLLMNKLKCQFDGLFWWGFYEQRNVDEFFEAALNYLSGGDDCLQREYNSSSSKSHLIAAMLTKGRYLFVLDGLEVLQHQDGDLYGSLLSYDLKTFLAFFAEPNHSSFCLITSRAPLVDLERYSTYKPLDIDRLSPEDGRNLLRRLGVMGEDKKLDQVVADWDGHALTLSLIASYLRDHHGGDVSQIENIPPPTANEPRYERVHRVLRRYDDHLQEAEKAFLMLFSAFRRPVEKDAFRIFRAKSEKQGKALSDPIAALNDSHFEAMLQRLITYRMLRYEERIDLYTTHPLIRSYYFTLLTNGSGGQAEVAHQQIKEYYLEIAKSLPYRPTLKDLIPLIEAVHHACKCGDYEEAYKVCFGNICKGEKYYILHELGAWETMLEIIPDFFPGGDISQEPIINDLDKRGRIISTLVLCLDITGQGILAEGLYQRAININIDNKKWTNASIEYINLSEFYSMKGDLSKGLQAASEALMLARLARNSDIAKSIELECISQSCMARTNYLLGDLKMAGQMFLEAERLIKEIEAPNLFLNRQMGIYHSDYLRRIGESNCAFKIAVANLIYCKDNNWPALISSCHRVLGDLFADCGKEKEATENYAYALDIARSISHRLNLIESLKSRGRWYARFMKDSASALSDLTEALEYARTGGYRLYEADIRNGLAWGHLAAGDKIAAGNEARYARKLSQDIGYYWGKKDAEEILAEM